MQRTAAAVQSPKSGNEATDKNGDIHQILLCVSAFMHLPPAPYSFSDFRMLDLGRPPTRRSSAFQTFGWPVGVKPILMR